MTEWEPFDDPTPGQSGKAFVAFACALAWLFCAPFDLYARLSNRKSSGSDDPCEGAEWGGEHLHDGGASK